MEKSVKRLRELASSGFGVTVGMLAVVILPAALTLHTVRQSMVRTDLPQNVSPYGYSISLLLFLVPSIAIVAWFFSQTQLKISKRAFTWSIALLFPAGVALDFFFARYFFVFPNAGATLGIRAPALGGGVPVEEYIFYLAGFMTTLLLYIWLDEYWFGLYSVPSDAAERVNFDRLLRFHPGSIMLAVALIGAGVAYQRVFAPQPAGRFPGYWVFLVLVSLLPSSVLLPTARPVINWRALSLTLFVMLVTSLLWEVTLALPYGWWNFREQQMIGVRVTAWCYLPIEEVYVWIGVSYSSVIVYEIVKRWKASGRSARDAFVGGRS